MERQGRRLLDFPRPPHTLHPEQSVSFTFSKLVGSGQEGCDPPSHHQLDALLRQGEPVFTVQKSLAWPGQLPSSGTGEEASAEGHHPLSGTLILLLLLYRARFSRRYRRHVTPNCGGTEGLPLYAQEEATSPHTTLVDDLLRRATGALHTRPGHPTAKLEGAQAGAKTTHSAVAAPELVTPTTDNGRGREYLPPDASN